MTADEPMSTPDSGGLRARIADHPGPGKVWVQIPHRNDIGNDWIEADISDWLAARPDPVPTPDSADDATVGEREACICGESHCRRCGLSAGAAKAGVLCDPPHAGSHDFATPPADDANRTPVSGVDALAGRWQEVLAECKAADPRWILDRSVTVLDGALDELRHALKSDRAGRAARDAAWVERLAAVEGERDDWKATAWGNADLVAGLVDRAESAEAERDTARREAGERIAQAKAEALREASREVPFAPAMSSRVHAWLRNRADAVASDDGSGA